MNQSKKILLVDDDTELTALLAEYLKESGFQVDTAASAEQANDILVRDQNYALIVLDVMMPGVSGLEFLSIIRTRWAIPVIMLTGRGDDIDRILGLEMGADDYLSKPCNTRELLARIKAVLRRSEQSPRDLSRGEFHIGPVALNRGTRRVSVEHKEVALTTAEFDVLAALMEQAGTAVSRESLTRKVLHRELSPYDRSIDVHLSRVRQALRSAYPAKELIVTIRGIGYQFIDQFDS